MKRILTLLLVLALTLATFASCEYVDQVKDMIGLGGEDTHEHNFVDGKCEECGEADPNYQPPEEEHTHNYVDGECECGEVDPEYDELTQASAYIHQLYKNDPVTTSADLTLVSKVTIGTTVFPVVWTVSDDRISVAVSEDGESVIIDVPDITEDSYEDIPFTLTATVTSVNGYTASRSYERNVPKFQVNTWEDYANAKEGDPLMVEGIVVLINSVSAGNTRNNLFVMDASGVGGYYNYQMALDPIADLGIKVGMTVRISGEAAPYYGLPEFKDASVKIIDETIKTFDFIDITEKFQKDTNFNMLVALPVVVKGVTLGGQDLAEKSQYLKFSLNGVESYIRTYVTDFPAGVLTANDKATIDALHKENFGNTADVYGIMITYSNNPYLIPVSVDCFTNIKEVEKSDEEKVAAELDSLTVAGKITSDTVLTLGTNGALYPEIAFSWASNNDCAVVEGGNVTIKVPDDATDIILTLTATLGDVTETKEFTVTLSKELTPIKDAIEIGAAQNHNTYTADKYLVGGIITEVYNSTYGNMYITDAEGNVLTIYGTYSADGSTRYDAMSNAPQAGDYVVILGILGQYNGTAQIKNGWIVSVSTSLDIPAANELGASKEHNTYTSEKYLVSGVITEIKNTTYGNLYIADEAGNTMYIYGLYDATGAVRFDKFTTALKVGDTITVLSTAGQYNGTAQLKNAWLVGYTAGTGDTHEHVFVDGKCECGEEDPNYVPPTVDPETPAGPAVVDPVVDTAYKFGMVQQNVGTDVYYLAGGMSSYYMATTTNYSAAIDVYLEATEGGYYLYTLNADGSKLYINMVVSGTHVNGAYEATASTVYTYNTESKTVIAVVNDADYWFGTRNDKTYTTVGPCAVSYAGFYCQFYGESAGTGDTHEHSFVDGKCECGEEDPNYVPPTVEPENPSTPDTSSSEALDIFATTGVLAADNNSISWTGNNFTFVNAKGTSSSNIRVTDADHFRVYKYNVTTISGTNGSKISKIDITCTNETQVGYLLGTTMSEGVTATSNGLVVTLTVEAPVDSIVITASNNQWRLNHITVYFA